MTAGLVGQDTISTFTSPVNGVSPIDANIVKGNDNTIKTAFNTHDADATIHFQSSTNASRPVAAVAGRKWMDSDTYRIYYDDGAAWHEIAYFSSSGGTITGNLSIVGTLGVTSDFAVNTSKFTVAAASGNTVVAGTLGVTGAITGSSDVLAGASAKLGWSSRGHLLAQSDGILTLLNNAETDFSRLQFGGTTSSFPALRRTGAQLDVVLADTSALAALASASLTTGSLTVTVGTTAVQALTATTGVFSSSVTGAGFIATDPSRMGWSSRSALFSVADGSIALSNNALSDFSLLQFGGSSASFPALKRSAATIAVRLADDSAGAALGASILTAGTAQTGSGAVLNLGDGTAMQPTWGFSTPSTIVGIDSAISLANASGVYLHGHFMTKQTVATTGSVQGLETWSWAAHTTGTVASLLGVIGNNSASGGGTTTLSISVAGGGVVSGGSTVTTFDGVQGGGVTVDGVGSVVTTLRGLHAIHGTAQNSGTIGTQYGLYVDDLTQATTNYAIFLAGKNDAVFNGSGAALATTAVVGFPYIPTCAGTPTGVPTNTATGRAPMVYDTTNNKIWFYNGSWRGVVVA